MDRRRLLLELDQTEQDFYSTLASFQANEVNVVPFEGSWTAGQVAEHILLSESGIPETVLGSTDETDRPVAQYVPVIESIFLDFSAKYKSPDFILPSSGPHNQQELLEAFKGERAEIRKIAASEDLTLTCTDFEFPQIAKLTRWEWLQFVLCHSKRHARQLRNIYEKVTR
ncbi:DinB family protein [Dyadobacter sp. CY261]|uniref:DinB family protein n=1 Tax=Dyadobacter sp. CY261 TaxID=2907203 RepID=UPI001F385DD0|nr:DinB family protein [Dyadobacter sp. CY261]MCF0070144.1 DinB family protein [Dyadobacter sp. CY261]